MRWFVIVIGLIAACGAKPVPRPPSAATRAPSDPWPWPVPMRVLTWTEDGIAQIGELPWSPPPVPPATPWFVEPTKPLDRAKLVQLVAALRSERVPGLSLRGQPIAEWLRELRELPALTALLLDDTGATDAGLAAMDVRLTRLYAARTGVTDAALPGIAARHPLEVLDLEGTAIGDAAMRSIGALAELRALNLSGTRISDAGGAAVRTLPKLEIADLARTAVGAATIAALRGLPIRELFLEQTRAGKELATLAGLAPGLRRFDVSSLASYQPSDGDLAWLAGASALVEVGLSNARVTDALAGALLKHPKLVRLRLAGTRITRATIEPLSLRDARAAFAPFEQIDLTGTPVDDASAARLIAGPSMRWLRLDRTPITDAALGGAPGPALGELYLGRTAVTDAGLVLLEQLPRLGALGLGETRIGAPTLARIAQLRGLTTLVLSSVSAPAESLAGLAQLRRLEQLFLDHTRATDATLAALAPLRGLRVLHVDNTDVSEASIGVLRGFARLEELSIGDTRIGDEIADLHAWPRLHTLSLLGLDVSDAALPALARRASLSALDLSGTEISDPAPLAALPRLRTLGLVHAALSPAGRASTRALAARGIEIVD